MFLIYDSNDFSFLLTGPVGGSFLYPPEDVFKRYLLNLVISVPNSDVIEFESEELTDSNAYTIDSQGRMISHAVELRLPFIMQLQELGKENKAPTFITDLPTEISVAIG